MPLPSRIGCLFKTPAIEWLTDVADVRGKFVSGAKVLEAVPVISQPGRVYRELYENEDRLETGGEAN